MNKYKPRKHQGLCIEAAFESMRASNDPALLDLTVGFGKSLICSWVAERMERSGRSTLILTMTSDLVDQNSGAFIDMSYQPSIFCSKLKKKEWQAKTVFATPQSLWAAIKNGHPIADRIFHLIEIDEAHNINAENEDTVYMKIFAHYTAKYPKMRILGMTGTPHRGGKSIVHKDLLFKKCVYRRSLYEEIADGNLLPLKYGTKDESSIDFSECKQTRLGNYREKDLEKALEGKGRLTSKIVSEVVEIARDYKGVFFFAATKNHCDEIALSLPVGTWRIITGDTSDANRIKYMEEAKSGKVKYLVSMNCLFTGVNIPHYGVVAWLRPTESLIMWLQGNGRVVRKCDDIGKTHGLVLDYAGNLDKFGDSDDESIIEYKKQQVEENEDPLLELPCPKCKTLNMLDARRCIGTRKEWDDDANKIKEIRCDHYFQFVTCDFCEASNDLSARNCRCCGAEIVDPNKKLSRRAARNEPQWGLVLGMQLSRHKGKKVKGKLKPDTLRVDYLIANEAFDNPMVTEWFNITSHRNKYLDWSKRSCTEIDARLLDLDEILENQTSFRAPTRLHFFRPRGEKYLRVISYDWGDNQPTTHQQEEK